MNPYATNGSVVSGAVVYRNDLYGRSPGEPTIPRSQAADPPIWRAGIVTYDPESRGVWVPVYLIELATGANAAIMLAQLTWLLQPGRAGERRCTPVVRDGHEWLARMDCEWESIGMDRSAAHRARQSLARDGLVFCAVTTIDKAKTTLTRPNMEALEMGRTAYLVKRGIDPTKARMRAKESSEARFGRGSSPLSVIKPTTKQEPLVGLDPVRRVFDAWINSTKRTSKTVLDKKRTALIANALRDYPEEDVLDAVRGWEHSAHHRGETTDNKQVYNDLDLLLRSASNIERFRDLARGPREIARTGPDGNGKPKSAIRMPIIEDRTPGAGPLTDEDLYGQR